MSSVYGTPAASRGFPYEVQVPLQLRSPRTPPAMKQPSAGFSPVSSQRRMASNWFGTVPPVRESQMTWLSWLPFERSSRAR